MSRALTVYSRKEAALTTDQDEIDRIMAAQGCSEPVAKNLLKYAKLGIGPLASAAEKDDRILERPREQFPPRLDRKAAALMAEQKLRERQQAEEEAEETRKNQQRRGSGMSRLGPVETRHGGVTIGKAAFEEEADPFEMMARGSSSKRDGDSKDSSGFFQQAARPAKKPMQIAGISKLGPVMAREEAQDPLDRDREPAAKEVEEDEPEDEADAEEEKRRQYTEWKKQHAADEEKRKRQNAGNKKDDKKKNKRKGRDSEDDEAKHGKRPRSESPDEDVGAGGSGKMMTEKEVMKMMGQQRKAESKRGSVRANVRIQKEIQEWESRKAGNAEFWKAPQFALCYSAETGKKARGAT